MKTFRNFSEILNEGAIALQDKAADANVFAAILKKYNGIKEVNPPGKNNHGPDVEAIQKRVGLNAGQPWCQAFVYTVFDDFCKQKGIPNPVPKVGGVLNHWNMAPSDSKITREQAIADPTKVKAGQVFAKSSPARGASAGHTGIVIGVTADGSSFMTLDGNSSDSVVVRTYKMSMPGLKGFVDYFQDPEFGNLVAQAAASLSGMTIAPSGPAKEF